MQGGSSKAAEQWSVESGVGRYRPARLWGLPGGSFHPLLIQPNGAICQRSEEHTSELQSLMRISYAVFCLNKKKNETIATDTLQRHPSTLHPQHKTPFNN